MNFKIEDGHLIRENGTSRRATPQEIHLWRELKQAQAALMLTTAKLNKALASGRGSVPK